MSESATPDGGSLSVEQAIATLNPEPAAQEANTWGEKLGDAVEDADAAISGQENTEGETSSPEEAADGDEIPAEENEAEAEPEAVAPVEPPKYWSQDAKAKFAALPPELQAVVLEQEGPREAAAAKAKAEAAEATQAANAETAKVAQLAGVLGERVGQWLETFQSRWGTQTPDWSAYAHENGVEAMVLLKTQFEAEQHQLAEAVQAKTIAENQAREATGKAELAKLNSLDPELAPDPKDPSKGTEKRGEVCRYLRNLGITEAAVDLISATEMVLAKKAMLWDQAQAKLSTAPKPKPAAPPVKSPVRPAASAPQSSAQRTAQQVQNRFAQTRSVDDAVALLLARKG